MYKGYYISTGYMGLIDGSYRLFATETEYLEIAREEKKDKEE